jgi:hypothetical protein
MLPTPQEARAFWERRDGRARKSWADTTSDDSDAAEPEQTGRERELGATVQALQERVARLEARLGTSSDGMDNAPQPTVSVQNAADVPTGAAISGGSSGFDEQCDMDLRSDGLAHSSTFVPPLSAEHINVYVTEAAYVPATENDGESETDVLPPLEVDNVYAREDVSVPPESTPPSSTAHIVDESGGSQDDAESQHIQEPPDLEVTGAAHGDSSDCSGVHDDSDDASSSMASTRTQEQREAQPPARQQSADLASEEQMTGNVHESDDGSPFVQVQSRGRTRAERRRRARAAAFPPTAVEYISANPISDDRLSIVRDLIQSHRVQRQHAIAAGDLEYAEAIAASQHDAEMILQIELTLRQHPLRRLQSRASVTLYAVRMSVSRDSIIYDAVVTLATTQFDIVLFAARRAYSLYFIARAAVCGACDLS